MVIILAAVVIGILVLAWFWKIPVRGLVRALEKDGSSRAEAYVIVLLLLGGSAAVMYLIMEVL
ncbi:hypothetical protein [Fodinibius sp.]|uniref:hypothetical protein n=1 Tax=Fodinibius sp. TaxID=1872440 RepID=UPI003567ECE6